MLFYVLSKIDFLFTIIDYLEGLIGRDLFSINPNFNIYSSIFITSSVKKLKISSYLIVLFIISFTYKKKFKILLWNHFLPYFLNKLKAHS